MLQPGDRVLAAVSGGPDSIALFHLLLQFRKELGFLLGAAHFDHQMRPDSGADLEFVQELASRHSVAFFCGSKNVPALVKADGGNLEEVARACRLEFLGAIAKRENFGKIATGHTLNDQAETVLMKLLRGAGSAGLGGIAPKVGSWIRPVIEVSRPDILSFLREGGLAFRQDVTNLDTGLLRNRIRHRLLPLLEAAYSHRILEKLSSLAEIERETARYWRWHCRRFIERDDSGPLIRVERLKRRPVAEQREAVRLFIFRARGHLRRISFEHTESVRRLVDQRAGGRQVVLPGGWEIFNAGGVLRARKRQ
jgi:tRNA(Ile)-lysidine synthase